MIKEMKPVVYCKECEYYYSYSENWGVCEYTRMHQEKALDVKPDHFCGWGEKKLTAEDFIIWDDPTDEQGEK